ncbi:MAG: hypothetical protein NUV80_03170 [Candidatus Berkelbacteria bacterium]|nr:hypothetical protein [Candidatus Berkelbacteria bacterium]
MIVPIFQGTITKGQLRAGVDYYKWLSTLEGQAVEIVVRKKRKQRSIPQNKFYWGIIVEMLSDFTGYNREEMHEALKQKFLGAEPDAHGLVKIKSTTVLTTDEFVNYTNRVVMWAAQSLGVYIPPPGSIDL